MAASNHQVHGQGVGLKLALVRRNPHQDKRPRADGCDVNCSGDRTNETWRLERILINPKNNAGCWLTPQTNTFSQDRRTRGRGKYLSPRVCSGRFRSTGVGRQAPDVVQRARMSASERWGVAMLNAYLNRTVTGHTLVPPLSDYII